MSPRCQHRREGTATSVCLATCSLVLVVAGLGEPAILGVNTIDDPGDGACTGDHCTLREAIAAAEPGDEIRFSWDLAGSTIVLDHDAGPLVIDRDLTISCLFGADNLAVSGDDWNTVFYVAAGVVAISGLSVRNGYGGSGPGGILNHGDLTLTECRLTANETFGIYTPAGIQSDGHLTVDRCELTGNRSFYGISALANTAGGTMAILDSTISNNGSTMGGPPVENRSGGQATILRTRITGNWTAEGVGGGFDNSGQAEVRDCTIADNFGYDGAGGIYNSGTLLVADTAVVNNSTSGFAIAAGIEQLGGTLTLSNVTVSGNQPGAGLGLYGSSASALVVNSTVTSNRGWNASLACSSGISVVGGGFVELQNTIVAGNVFLNDPHNPNADCCGTVSSLGTNLFGLGTGCPAQTTDLTVNPDDVFASLLDQSLTDNGGLTSTHALLPGSPCIDSADPIACPATDQRGFPRPYDGDGDLVPVCDIGAYEYAPDLLFFDGFESRGCTLWSSSRP